METKWRLQGTQGNYRAMDVFFILDCSFILKHICYNLIKLCIFNVCGLLDLIKIKKVFLHLFEISCHSVRMEAQGQFASVYSFFSILGVPKNETQVLRFGPEYPNQLSHLAGPLLVVVSFSFCLKAVTVTREIRLGM